MMIFKNKQSSNAMMLDRGKLHSWWRLKALQSNLCYDSHAWHN